MLNEWSSRKLIAIGDMYISLYVESYLCPKHKQT